MKHWGFGFTAEEMRTIQAARDVLRKHISNDIDMVPVRVAKSALDAIDVEMPINKHYTKEQVMFWVYGCLAGPMGGINQLIEKWAFQKGFYKKQDK